MYDFNPSNMGRMCGSYPTRTPLYNGASRLPLASNGAKLMQDKLVLMFILFVSVAFITAMTVDTSESRNAHEWLEIEHEDRTLLCVRTNYRNLSCDWVGFHKGEK